MFKVKSNIQKLVPLPDRAIFVFSPQVPVIHDGQSPAKSARKVLWDGSRDSSVVEKLLQSGGGLKGYGNSGGWVGETVLGIDHFISHFGVPEG